MLHPLKMRKEGLDVVGYGDDDDGETCLEAAFYDGGDDDGHVASDHFAFVECSKRTLPPLVEEAELARSSNKDWSSRPYEVVEDAEQRLNDGVVAIGAVRATMRLRLQQRPRQQQPQLRQPCCGLHWHCWFDVGPQWRR